MRVSLQEESWEIENLVDIQKSIDDIGAILKMKDVHYSYMVVDGLEVYEPYQDYLQEKLGQMDNVVLVVKTYRELKNDMLVSLKEYLHTARPQMQRLAEVFYQGADDSAWSQFAQLADALEWIIQVLPNLGSNQDAYNNQEQYMKIKDQLIEKILLLSEALESRDTLQMADLIQYELHSLFDNLYQTILKTMDDEGVCNDID